VVVGRVPHRVCRRPAGLVAVASVLRPADRSSSASARSGGSTACGPTFGLVQPPRVMALLSWTHDHRLVPICRYVEDVRWHERHARPDGKT